MADDATMPDTKADPGALVLEFRHTHRLIDPSEEGVQTWRIDIAAGDQAVGSLRATRGLYWKADNLRERMADEQSFLALVAEQLLDADGKFRPEFEAFVDMASSVLVVDELDFEAPWNDPWIVAGVAASIIDRLTDNQFAVVFPHAAPHGTGAALLAEAATLLSAEPFSEDLLILDTALAAPEEATHRARERLRYRARYGGALQGRGLPAGLGQRPGVLPGSQAAVVRAEGQGRQHLRVPSHRRALEVHLLARHPGLPGLPRTAGVQ